MHHQEKRAQTGIEEIVVSCFFFLEPGNPMRSSNTELFLQYSDIRKVAQKNLYADFVVSRYCI